MMSMWMAWAVAVTTLLGLSAVFAERVLRSAKRPTRWAWLSALVGSLALQLWSLLGRAPAPAPGTDSTELVPGGLQSGGSWAALGLSWLVDFPIRVADAASRLDTVLTVGWATGTALLTLSLAGGLMLLRARASSWRRARVEGEEILVSADFGPALVGVWSPRIVLPGWALRLPPKDLSLAYRHEVEHRAAHDTWVLFAGALAVSLMPWTAGLWWYLRRLRTAVEMDCDARVLRAGVSRRAYGALLLRIGSAQGNHRLPVLALARSKSLLERRLRMIVTNVSPRRPLHSIATAGVVVALVVAACETPAPTTPIGEETVVAEPAGAFLFSDPAEEPGADRAWPKKVIRMRSGELDKVRIFVDGEALTGSVRTIDPGTIERVEIIKGAAAEGLYGAGAEGGVIHIYTKEAAGRPTPR
jgi:hypothetical protein